MSASPQPEESAHLSTRVGRALTQLSPWRSTGLRLLLAMVLFMILGAGWIRRIESAEGLFAFLASALAFFFIVMVFAIRDFRKLAKRYMVDKENVFGETMGNDEFVSTLRTRVSTSATDTPWTAPDLPDLCEREAE